MQKSTVLIWLIFALFICTSGESLFGQSKRVIVKLNSKASGSLIEGFKRNNIKNSASSLGILCSKYNLGNSQQLFGSMLSEPKNKDMESYGLGRIFIAEIDGKNLIQAVKQFSGNEFVEYFQTVGQLKLNNYYKTDFTPNDPLYNNQYYLGKIGLPELWNIVASVPEITIGIVDSGLDFLHPDLLNGYKINPGEYGNGRESNGIDDDGNGFIDDWRGWNFVDNSNDPSDDNLYSHGTSVTGLVSAGFNNGIGISPVMSGCKSLVLKAFNSQGAGEEDAVASAILYGISSGVKVFNFSFGDYIYSNLLLDVIRYAYSKNIVMVCSAGNDNSDKLHFPSAFDEVISVGASDFYDRKATFSAYGETVDLFAPGVDLLTTSRIGFGSTEFNKDYFYVNGTSFSAPLAASVAAILAAKNPNLTNEEIRGILVSSSNYFPGQSGWNHLYASGYLNATVSYQNIYNPSVARIYFPFQNYSGLSDTLPLYISAASAFFRSYTLSYGIGENPSAFVTVIPLSTNQVLRDTAGWLNLTGLPDTSYTLRLSINGNNGKTIEHRMIITKNKSQPEILYYSNGNISDNDYNSQIVYFYTDVPTLGYIYYRKKNSYDTYNFIYADAGSGNIGYVSNEHYGLLKSRLLVPNTEYEFYIEAMSENSRKVSLSDTSFHFYTGSQFYSYGYPKKPYNLPVSQICNTVLDVLNNGSKCLFTNDIRNNLRLNVYNYTGGGFVRLPVSPEFPDFTVARDLADINSNGKIDLLTSGQRSGAIYEAPAAGQLPAVKIWNSNPELEFWSSKFADAEGDGQKEVLGFSQNGLRILKYSSGGFQDFALLPYSTANSQANSQNVLTGDFDNDGKTDIIFTENYFPAGGSTQNTIINVYEHQGGNNFTKVYSYSIPMVMKGDNLTGGDFDGDGKQEFAAGLSSQTLVPYFSIFVFKNTGNNAYTVMSNFDVYNHKTTAEISSESGDIDGDNKSEILINTGNNYYIFKYSAKSSAPQAVFLPSYYMPGINSFNQIVFDFDNNGIPEIGVNTQDSLIFIEKETGFSGPPVPSNITAFSPDSAKVKISFSPVQGADYYRIYRSQNDTIKNSHTELVPASILSYNLIDSTLTSNFSDNTVINRRNYLYKISAVDTNLSVRESGLSNAVIVYVHNKSKISQTQFLNNILSVRFSEKVALKIPNMTSFIIGSQIGNPENIGFKNDFEYVLSFEKFIPDGTYSLRASALTDFYGSPVDTAAVSFTVNRADSLLFYVKSVSLIESRKLRVEFNLDADTVSSRNPSCYAFEPFGFSILSVTPADNSKRAVNLTLDNKGTIGASGRIYFLRVSNVYSGTGIKIVTGAGSSFSLSYIKEDLNSAVVYPNPYKISSGQGYLTFANLTKTVTISVYDVTGSFIAEVKEEACNGGIQWQAKDSKGRNLPTGIYIFRAEGKNSSGADVEAKTGKFAVIK